VRINNLKKLKIDIISLLSKGTVVLELLLEKGEKACRYCVGIVEMKH